MIVECLFMAIQFEEQNFDLMSNLDERAVMETTCHEPLTKKPQTNKESQS